MNGPSSQPVTASNSSSTRNGNGNGNGSGINSSSNSDALSPGLPSSRVDTIDVHGARILCVADIRGKISQLNDLAAEHKAQAIIHTGDFGFYDDESVERMADKTLRHVLQYTKLIDTATREKHYPGSPSSPNYPSLGQLRDKLANPSPELVAEQNGNAFILSEFPKLRSGEIKLEIPVYTVAGACEDIAILEKLRLAPPSPITTRSSGSAAASATTLPQTNEYSIPNLTVLSEGVTRVLHIGGVKLRLFGLGGSVVPHKLFDNGEGNATMAGGSGTIWTTALQVGELVDTAARVFDQSETRLLVTHAAPGREGLIAQVALALKCDFTISASLHFRYGTSYNDFSVRADTDSYRTKFVQSSRAFAEVYDAVKTQVESVIDEHQKKLLQNALSVSRRVPDEKAEEPAWKNSWNWNLTDAAFGTLVLDIKDGRIASEMKSSGFNFAYRLKINDKSSSPAQSQNQSSSNPGSQQQQQSRNNRLPFAPKHLQSGFQGHRAQGQGNHSQSPNSAAASPTAQSEPRSQSPSQPTQPQSQQGQGQGQGQSQSQGQERSQSPATSTPTTTALQGQKGAAPSPNAFASMTDSFFRGGRGGRGAHLGPRIGHSAAPGAGRGRGSADLGQYVSQQSRHTPNSSGGGNNGNASGNVNNGARGKQEDAMASTGDAPASSQKKEEGQGQNRNEGTAQSAQIKPETPAPAAPSDSKDIPVSVAPSGPAGETGNAAGNSSNGQQQQQQQQQQQKRPSNLQKRGDSSADWRAQDRSQDPASSEGEGGYSSSRGGRGGRGRGRGGEGRGGFQEGRGGPRGGRGGRGGAGGRGGRSFSGVQGEGGNSSAGEAGPANSGANDNSNSNANANAKPAASPAPAASSATTPAPSS